MSTSSKRPIFGWMMFDWASQPFYTLLLTFIFGPYVAATLAEFYLASGLDSETAKANAQSLWSGTIAMTIGSEIG